MRRIREVLRLKHECALPNAQVAAALGIAKGSVANYLAAAAAAGLTHREALTLNDAALNARLHPQCYVYPQFAVPDFAQVLTAVAHHWGGVGHGRRDQLSDHAA